MGSDPPMSFSDQTIVSIKSRISDMALASDNTTLNKLQTTEREKELVDMVEKLLDSYIDPEQLERQAEFINWLTTQRDLLVRSFEEERKRWEAERDGWARMAEALIAQGAKKAMAFGGKDEELERQYATLESENRALREKLQDANKRYSTLESELDKLKPLLLMQPPSLLDFSDPTTTISTTNTLPESTLVQSTKAESRRGKRRDLKATNIVKDEDLNKVDPTIQINNTTPKRTTTTQTPDYYRRLDSPQTRSTIYQSPLASFVHSTGRFSIQQTPSKPSHNTSSSSTFQTPSTHPGLTTKKSKIKNKKLVNDNLLPIAADARTEHLLLAARKIGRERANMMSGFMRRIAKEQEKLNREKELERLERERLEKSNTTGTGTGNSTSSSSSYYRKEALDGTMSNPASFIGLSHNTPNPKTPKRGSTTSTLNNTRVQSPSLMTPRSSDYYSNHSQQQQHLTPSFVFVGTPTAGSSYGTLTMNTSGKTNSNSNALPVTTSSHAPPPQTNQKQSSQASIKTPARATNPPTPFDSLLSAARSMVHDGDTTHITTKSTGRRKAGAIEPPESPLPKRRRIGNSNSSSNIGNGNGDMLENMISLELVGTKARTLTPTPSSDRVRSALDVLADQAAAAFSSETQTPTKANSSSVKNRTNRLMRGSGSGLSIDADEENEEDEEDLDVTPKGKTTSFMSKATRSRARANSLRSQNRKRKVSGASTSISTKQQSGPRIIAPPRSWEEEEMRHEVDVLPFPEINGIFTHERERHVERTRSHSPISLQGTMTEMNFSDVRPTTSVEAPPTNNTEQNDEDAEGENDPDVDGHDVSPVPPVAQAQVLDVHDTDVDAEGDMDVDEGSLGPPSSGQSFVNASASRSNG